MRRTKKAAASAGVRAGIVAAGFVTAGCLLAACAAAATPAVRPATVNTCYAFGVRAIRQHVTVTTVPRACAGLSHEELNEAVVRAVHAAVGSQHKAGARHRASVDSRYLADLVSAIRPPRPAADEAAPTAPSSSLPANLGALLAWIVTVGAGAYLLSGWPPGTRLRRRPGKPASVPLPVIVGHAGLAVTGLLVWIAYMSTSIAALAWIAVAMVAAIAGLGMATLVTGLPEPGPGARPAGRAPVFVIAAHGILATATMMLVLLAAIAS